MIPPRDFASLRIISDDARIDESVKVGAFSIVHPGVEIEAGSVIESYCEVGSPDGRSLYIGPGALVRSFSSVAGGSSFGPNLRVGNQSCLFSEVEAGRNFQVGSHCEVHTRARVGDYVRMQSYVTVAKQVAIGDFVWIMPGVSMINDPLPPSHVHLPQVIGDMSVVGAHVTLMPGVVVGDASFIGSGSVVRRSISSGMFANGNPARELLPVDRLVSPRHGLSHPWPTHFLEGLDKAGVLRLRNLVNKFFGPDFANKVAIEP